jgi:MoxR-like ATPase
MTDLVPMTIQTAADNVRSAVADACKGLVQRNTLVELVVLCAVAREHLLVIGPPGTGKSEAVRRTAQRLGGRYFEYLVGKFTEPTEIFGPVNLRKLKEGVVETDTAGMLPDADIAFLDEIFLGSTAILNTLLGILNERTFRRGHTHLRVPLRVCVAASNRMPDDEQLAAFADRFLVRVFVEPIGDSLLEALLSSGASRSSNDTKVSAALTDIDALSAAAEEVDLTSLRPAIAQAVRQLRSSGVELTDRRVVRVQRLIAAAAVLAGRTHATEADLWPIVFALPTDQAQHAGRDVLRDLLRASENTTLQTAPAEGSLGARARATRIAEHARAVLDDTPVAGSDLRAWHLRLEGAAREIDATFSASTTTETIAALRARIVEALAP